MSLNKKNFYDVYHQKNNNHLYHSLIHDNNFTYFYTLKYLQKILKDFTGEKLQILDLGCGVGSIDFYLAKLGHHVTGIDISKNAIDICLAVKKEFSFVQTEFFHADIQKMYFKKKFDLVICSEVIEHVEDEVGLLESIFAVLKPGGKLLLTTPSLNAPLFKLGLLKKFDQQVGHLRRYDLLNLTQQVDNVGFIVIQTSKTESILRNALFTWNGLGIFIKFIRGPFIPIFHLLDQFLASIFGESDLVVIAQKP